MPVSDELEAFRERARALRQRAEAAETPLDRTTLEETARRFETLAAELAGPGIGQGGGERDRQFRGGHPPKDPAATTDEPDRFRRGRT